jgi:hypothetical protein
MTSTGLHGFYDTEFGVKPMKNQKPQAVLSTGFGARQQITNQDTFL